MNFCLCGNSTCICEVSCTCFNRGCLCSVCHNLRKKDWRKECLPSSYRELAERSSGVGTTEWGISPILPVPAQVYSPGSSYEVVNGSIKETESSISQTEPRAKDFQQVSSNQALIPIEQEMVPIQDTEVETSSTNTSNQPPLCSSEYFSRKDYFRKVPNEQIYKAITFFEDQTIISNDDSESSSEEISVAKEAFDYLSQQPKSNQSNSAKSSDISSTWERVELPSSRSSSDISILEFPENEGDLSSQAEQIFTGDHLVAISSIAISPNLMLDNVGLQQPDITAPTMVVLDERTKCDASPGRSISPIQIITTTNPTVLVAPSGELYLLPLQNSRSLQPTTPANNSIPVSQSANLSLVSYDSGVKVSSKDVPPMDIQNSENLQTEYREKLSSTLEACTSNIPEQ